VFSAPPSSHNDAPHIDERAATRGRMATEGGDERAGAKERGTLAPSLLRTAGRNSGRIWRVVPGPTRRGLRIAVGGLPSGPHAVVFMGAPNLSYSPFSSRSPAGTQETRSQQHSALVRWALRRGAIEL
jgi:hypothetical protein